MEFMDKAFECASKALDLNEVPVGCIFVYKNAIIFEGKNSTNQSKNATRHAELNCVDQVVDYCKKENLDFNKVFEEIDVYVTVEPCIMCASALYQINVRSINYGCKNDRFGGTTVLNVHSLIDKEKTKTAIKGGYRAEDALNLLKKFYKGVNPSAPISKAKTKGKEN